MIEKTACFTGHRKITSEKIENISQRLKTTIIKLIENGYLYFGVGGALGFDTLVALTILDLKPYYPQIKLILVLPCISQPDAWNEKDKLKYQYIKEHADKVVIVSHEYTQDCMRKRNRHLVDYSSLCVCYLTKGKGGTAYTVDYAIKKGLIIKNLAK